MAGNDGAHVKVRLQGYESFLAAVAMADKGTKKVVRARLRQVAMPIRDDVENRFEPYSPKSASGYRVIVRKRGISVEQKYRKIDGSEPSYAPLQVVKALDPAYEHGKPMVIDAMGDAMDDIADIFVNLMPPPGPDL